MSPLSITIQIISIYRALAMFTFISFYTVFSKEFSSFLLLTSLFSDILDGYLARKFGLTSVGGKLLDWFSDKYLNCICVIFLIIENYPLIPLLIILTKEIFILSFRSITINGKFIIESNRTIGGIMTGLLWMNVFLSLNSFFLNYIGYIVSFLGVINFLYIFYKIKSNLTMLKHIFKS